MGTAEPCARKGGLPSPLLKAGSVVWFNSLEGRKCILRWQTYLDSTVGRGGVNERHRRPVREILMVGKVLSR
jgi:hypothetical protein